MKKSEIDYGRRKFLKVSYIAGCALLADIYFPGCSSKTENKNRRDNLCAPDAWIKIGSDNTVTVIVNHSEMGQGITTAFPMIVAEELEADWSKIRFEIAPAAEIYKNPAFNYQMTGGSTSVRTSFNILRNAGATLRELMIAAAAKTWNAAVSECRAENSRVFHRAGKRSLTYGELIDKAANLPLPKNIPLKKPAEFKIIGKRMPRLDTLEKVYGSAVFGTDVKMPGLLTATVVHPPVFGTKLKRFNSGKTRALPGVRDVVVINEGIAVVADTFWQARQGMEALEVEWTKSSGENPDSEKISQRWAKLANKEGKTIYKIGDVDKFFKKNNNIIRSIYELPYQAHATPSPMNCTAQVRDNRCDIWGPTQNQDAVQEVASKITGLDYASINVYTTFVGGGFGRRISADYAAEAVQISKKVKAPVKVIWTREEDMQHDFYRPASYNVMQAVLNHKGLPVAWMHRIVGADHLAQRLPERIPLKMPYKTPRLLRNLTEYLSGKLVSPVMAGMHAKEGAVPLPYNIDNVRLNFVNDDPGIPLGPWRSVSHSANAFIVECFIDEIAALTGRDPYELRYELLSHDPHMRNVLELAARKSGWGKPLPDGIHRGISFHEYHKTILCFVAEVSVSRTGKIKVHRVVCAIDCGIVINPKIIEVQMESAVAFGLTATLKSAITIRKGRVKQANFDDFPILRMNEMPKVEVHLVKSTNPPTGIGEAGVPLIAPAVANAVSSAAGKRIRKLPINLN
ncbi:MAG: xanthine dehydrogenase family protein molybdopterin-binding subunit [Candidatus Aminicenantes bacterium]|nr:xanthine dehydrogenase family protein molybdopterin-binding subunit [Candidatus Aminicenantes bacterium]